ncbi:MAG: DNA-directed RNA polymerase I subunit RPA1, partial [Amphiamblys sp. WSBS2006]
MDVSFQATEKIRKLTFGFADKDDIRKLSVVRVFRSESFDGLGSNIKNGLYDLAMGPTDFHSVCTTCGKGFRDCTGHFGHIELPLPVYNPMLEDILRKVAKMVCVECCRVSVSGRTTFLFIKQLKNLSAGRIEVVFALKEVIESRVVRTKAELIALVNALESRWRYEGRSAGGSEAIGSLRREIMRGYFKLNSAKCDKCTRKNTQYVYSEGKMFLRNVVRDKAAVDGQILVAPVRVLSDLRKVWKNDRKILRALLPGITADSFFVRVVPVMPNRFRPLSAREGEDKFECSTSRLLGDILRKGNEIVAMSKNENEDRVRRILDLAGEMQKSLAALYGLSRSNPQKDPTFVPGVKQIIEGKNGLFRNNIMGKRVLDVPE